MVEVFLSPAGWGSPLVLGLFLVCLGIFMVCLGAFMLLATKASAKKK